jgi:hypothetical protein
MNVADGLKRLKRTGPEMMNGAGGSSDPEGAAPASAPGALMAALPVALLLGGAVFALRRRSQVETAAERAQAKRSAAVAQAKRSAAAAAQVKDRVRKARPGRRRPRNVVRYYSIGLLIALIERDVTRKVLVSTLKMMQKRA